MADLIIMIATIGLSFAIIPTLRSNKKPPLLTSIGFTAGVLIIGGALLSLHLWLEGTANVISGLLWGVVVVQTLYLERKA